MERSADTPGIKSSLEILRAGGHAGREETRRLVAGVLAGHIDLEDFGRWLVALADLGESAAEIAGVADALRERMVPVRAAGIIADTCGTGGDGSGSFNVSTAAALVAAAAGLPVAKHGNRAVTSRTGSADVLEALGVPVGGPADAQARQLADDGFCFCLAPAHHPAMARVGPLRRSLGRPTVFNLVGPLCNPAGATVQVIGVGRATAREPLASAAGLLGIRRAVIVSGHVGDGPAAAVWDEVSLFGPTDVIDVADGVTISSRWTPEDFGIARQPPAAADLLRVDGPAESAAAIRAVLGGESGPRRDVVVLNAAAVLWAAGSGAAGSGAAGSGAAGSGAAGSGAAGSGAAARFDSLPAARQQAEDAIDSGSARRLLERLAASGATTG